MIDTDEQTSALRSSKSTSEHFIFSFSGFGSREEERKGRSGADEVFSLAKPSETATSPPLTSLLHMDLDLFVLINFCNF